MIDVSVVRCHNYNQDDVDKAVEEAIKQIGGISKFVKKNEKVFIKVNMLMARTPDKFTTTHPAVVAALIKLIKPVTKHIWVGDTNCHEMMAKKTGFKDMAKKLGVKLTDLGQGEIFQHKRGIVKRFTLAKEIKKFDTIITVPKLKTHSLCILTGAVKNLYGFIPGKLKMKNHMTYQDMMFNELLLDLYEFINPKLALMDGIEAMEGNGPSSGNMRKVNAILASSDALALDRVACKIVNLSYVPIIHLGKKRDLPGSNLRNINIKGDNINIKDFKSPSGPASRVPFWAKMLLKKFLTKKPVLIKEKCTHCGICAEVCPVTCIEMKGNPKIPYWDYKACIRCYCCHEYCPAHAIELKR